MTTTETHTSTDLVASLIALIEAVDPEDGSLTVASGENGQSVSVSVGTFARWLTDAAFSARRYTHLEYRAAAKHLMDHWYGDDIDAPGETVLMVLLDQGREAHGEEPVL